MMTTMTHYRTHGLSQHAENFHSKMTGSSYVFLWCFPSSVSHTEIVFLTTEGFLARINLYLRCPYGK